MIIAPVLPPDMQEIADDLTEAILYVRTHYRTYVGIMAAFVNVA